MRWDLRGRAGEQKAEAPSGTTEAKSSLFVVGGVSAAALKQQQTVLHLCGWVVWIQSTL